MKDKLRQKVCAVCLSALMLIGIGAAQFMPLIDTGLSVHAAETTADNFFEYEENDKGTITLTLYKGSFCVHQAVYQPPKRIFMRQNACQISAHRL